jgi:hypothetical protein
VKWKKAGESFPLSAAFVAGDLERRRRQYEQKPKA